jgi:hypothetical protein
MPPHMSKVQSVCRVFRRWSSRDEGVLPPPSLVEQEYILVVVLSARHGRQGTGKCYETSGAEWNNGH